MTLQSQQAGVMAFCLSQVPIRVGEDHLQTEQQRWGIYRHMVQHRLLEMIRQALPRTVSLVREEQLKDCFGRYLQDAGPNSRYIRDVVTEFGSYAEARWRASGSMPAIVTNVLRYEAECWSRAFVPASFPSHVAEFSFDLPVSLNPTLCLLDFDYPVHKASVAMAVSAEPTHLAIFRDPDSHRVHTFTLTSVNRELLRGWRRHATLPAQEVVSSTYQRLGLDITPQSVKDLCDNLVRFLEQKLVLGSSLNK